MTGTPGARTADTASSSGRDDDDHRGAAEGAASITGGSDDGDHDLRRRTDAVEALPLAERADAFAALHDDLRTRLEQGEAPRA
ncbi:hypothetical protein DEI83_12480 [Curtobacterium sp. MCBD17_021]|nr:hypothetical protein DEI83_12480 [Curtobacterium sp. MCBD17_021]